MLEKDHPDEMPRSGTIGILQYGTTAQLSTFWDSHHEGHHDRMALPNPAEFQNAWDGPEYGDMLLEEPFRNDLLPEDSSNSSTVDSSHFTSEGTGYSGVSQSNWSIPRTGALFNNPCLGPFITPPGDSSNHPSFQLNPQHDGSRFPLPLPTITSLVPQTGSITGGIDVVISGPQFTISDILYVYFGDHYVSAKFEGTNAVSCTVPPSQTAGLVPVYLSRSNGNVSLPIEARSLVFRYLQSALSPYVPVRSNLSSNL